METSNYLPYDLDKSFGHCVFRKKKWEWKRIAHKKARARVREFLQTGRDRRKHKFFVTGWDID